MGSIKKRVESDVKDVSKMCIKSTKVVLLQSDRRHLLCLRFEPEVTGNVMYAEISYKNCLFCHQYMFY